MLALALPPQLVRATCALALVSLASCKVQLDRQRPVEAPPPAAAAEAQAAEGIVCEFVVAPRAASGATPAHVEVEARYRGLGGEETLDFLLPDRHSYVQLEPRWRNAPQAFGARGKPFATESVEPWRLRVTKGGASEVVLLLDVLLDHREQPAVVGRDEYEHPGVLADGSLILFGSALFPLPESLPQDRPLQARVVVDDPRPLVSSWPRATDGALAPSDPWALQSDLLLVGAFDVARLDVEGAAVQCAFAPGNERLRPIVPPLVEAVVREQCARMARAPAGDWLYVFNPPADVQGRSLAGSPKRTSMTLSVSGRFADDELRADLAHLMAHEFHHTFATARGPGFEGELRFVGEGFTDWYAWQSARLCGALSDERWTKVLAGKLADDRELRTRARLSLAEAGGMAFFLEPQAYEQVYTCGYVLAAVLDAELAAAGAKGGFDEFYRGLLDAPPADLDAFLERVGQATTPATRAWFEGALRGRDADALARLAALGVPTSLETKPPQLRANLERVVDASGRAFVRVVDLDPADPAALHGLAAGDIIDSVAGARVDSAADVQRLWAVERGDTLELACRRGEQAWSIVMPAPKPGRTVVVDARGFLARAAAR